MTPSSLFYGDTLEPAARNGSISWTELPNNDLPFVFFNTVGDEEMVDEVSLELEFQLSRTSESDSPSCFPTARVVVQRVGRGTSRQDHSVASRGVECLLSSPQAIGHRCHGSLQGAGLASTSETSKGWTRLGRCWIGRGTFSRLDASFPLPAQLTA